MSFIIKLPIPSRLLSPNHTVGSTGGRMAKASAIKKYRTIAKIAALSQFNMQIKPRWKEATVTIKWFSKTARKQDGDNIVATMKSAFDGFTDAGLFADDRGLTHMPAVSTKDAVNPRVEIHIEPQT